MKFNATCLCSKLFLRAWFESFSKRHEVEPFTPTLSSRKLVSRTQAWNWISAAKPSTSCTTWQEMWSSTPPAKLKDPYGPVWTHETLINIGSQWSINETQDWLHMVSWCFTAFWVFNLINEMLGKTLDESIIKWILQHTVISWKSILPTIPCPLSLFTATDYIWLYSKWLQQIRLWRNCDCCKRCQNLEHLGTCEQCRLEHLKNSSFEVLTCKEWKQYKAILQYVGVLQCFAAWRNVSDSGRSRHLLFLVSIWTAGNATLERLLGLH